MDGCLSGGVSTPHERSNRNWADLVMGKRGEGYGSEDHFLRYRSERAEQLNAALLDGLGVSDGDIEWIYPTGAQDEREPEGSISYRTERTSLPAGESTGHSAVARKRGTVSRSCTAAGPPNGCLSKRRPTRSSS